MVHLVLSECDYLNTFVLPWLDFATKPYVTILANLKTCHGQNVTGVIKTNDVMVLAEDHIYLRVGVGHSKKDCDGVTSFLH